jgi:hypothetical protein
VKDGSTTVTATPDGIDLEGTFVSKGGLLEPGRVRLDAGWYSGYLRVATNERGVVRSYYSAGEADTGRRIEMQTRRILEDSFNGKVIE